MNRYESLYQEELQVEESISASPAAWQDFLNTAARMYKYSFPDQLNIYAQRPEATAVADMKTWNKRIGRMVKRGSSAIFLRDPQNRGVRYVFDYSDTEPYRRESNLPGDIRLWQLGEHTEAVEKQLKRVYGTEDRLAEQIMQAALLEVGSFYDAHQEKIDAELSQCALPDGMGQAQRGAMFLRLAYNSSAYVVARRCGIDLGEQQFADITLLDQMTAVEALGFAVQLSSGTILRHIERTVRAEERNQQKEAEQNHEKSKIQSHLHGEGRLPVSRRAGGRRGSEQVPGQVRLDAGAVSERNRPDEGIQDVDGRKTASPPVRDSGAGQRARGADGTAHGGAGEAARPGDEPVSVGTGDGHAEGAGRGSGDPGADLHRLTEDAERPEPVDRLWLLEEALTGEYGLLELSDIDNISRQFDGGKSTGDVAQRLALTYEGQRREATAYDQLPISYEAGKDVFRCSVSNQTVSVPWIEVAAILHQMYLDNRRGFIAHHNTEETELSEEDIFSVDWAPSGYPKNEPYAVTDERTGNYVKIGGEIITFATEEEALDFIQEMLNDERLAAQRDAEAEELSARHDEMGSDYQEEQRRLEANLEEEKPFVASFYVVADLSNHDAPDNHNAEFQNLEDAISAYRALPEDAEKSLGVFRSTDGEPLDLLERIHREDILYRDYLLLEGWNHPEMQEAAVTLFQQFPQKGIRQLSRYQFLRGQGPDYPEGIGAYSLQQIVTDLPERLNMNTVRKLVRDGGSTADLYLAYWLSTALEGQAYTIEGAVYADARPEGYCIHITGEERYAVVYGWNEIAEALMEQVQDAIRTEIALSSYLPDIAGYLADEPTGEYVTMLTGDNMVITYLQRSDGVDVWYGDAPKGDSQLSVTMAELSEAVEAAKQAAQTVPVDPVLDALLRTGGNQRNGVLRIIAFHQLQGGDFASFLREEFCDDGT